MLCVCTIDLAFTHQSSFKNLKDMLNTVKMTRECV